MDKNPQGTAGWFQDRLGKVTASKLHCIAQRAVRNPEKPLKKYDDYKAQLVLERLTGKVAESFVTEAMEIGMAREDAAALTYAMETGADVQNSPFVPHGTIADCGASPDRLVGESGLIEIKCPQPAAHMDFIMTNKIKEEYVWQMQWQMACTGRQWCDFVSYNPDFPPHLVARTKRVERDNDAILSAESLVIIFLDEVRAQVVALESPEVKAVT